MFLKQIELDETLKKVKTELLTWAQIDLKAIEYNLMVVRRFTAKNEFSLPTRQYTKKTRTTIPQQILVVIKADAYGHGMERIGLLLDQLGVGFLGVSDVSEGKRLREAGIKVPILLLESTLPSLAENIIDDELLPTICTFELAQTLDLYAQNVGRQINVHIKVDTGMGRLGVWYKEAFDFIKKIHQGYNNLIIQGIYTHFPVAETDRRFTEEQIKNFYQLVLQLDEEGIVIPYLHAANSIGLVGYQTKIFNLARPGLMIYGLYPHVKLKNKIHLKPAMSVKSKIIFLKGITKGRSISYGRTFVAKRNMKVATIPIGYNDGYLRFLSNKASVIIGSERCPVLGNVTMDQIVVDVTKVKNVRLGSQVTVLGQQNNQWVSAEELATYAKTINYEIVCCLGNRLPRIYK